MPDMKKPGAHICKMRDIWELRIKENRRKANKLTIEADALEGCCADWDAALRREDELIAIESESENER